MINSVRNTVLSVLNKNNYGYISPSDFNLYAKQAQMELYDEYFSTYNKVVNAENLRASGTDYADIRKTVMEVLEYFLVSDFLIPFNSMTSNIEYARNRFYNPSLITTGNEAYMINKVVCYPKVIVEDSTCTSTSAYLLIDSSASFLGVVSPGDIAVNKSNLQWTFVSSVQSDTSLQVEKDIFTTGNDYYIISAKNYVESEKINAAKITMLNLSNLTAPSSVFPAYTQQYELMQIYPISDTFSINRLGQLQAQYFRYPKVPKWTYITLTGGEPSFDQSQLDYQDFELPLEDEYKLAVKILQYCGISIRESEVTQFGMLQEQHEQPSFSQKQ